MKKRSIINRMVLLTLSTSLLVYTSCANNENEDNDDAGAGTAPQEEEQSDEGDFRVIVVPTNPVVVNNINTVNNINVEGDEIDINIFVRGVLRSGRHRQYVHRGRTCPTRVNDQNQDGYVDGVEASQAVGDILIPLDGDLETQESGIDTYRTSNMSGEYDYTERASYSRLLGDLRAPDLDPADNVGKLGPGEELNITSRVVVFYGLSLNIFLPPTVRGFPGKTPHESFPIGCGPMQTQTLPTTSGGTFGGTTDGGTSGGSTFGGSTIGGSTIGGTSGETAGGTTTGGQTTGGTTTGG